MEYEVVLTTQAKTQFREIINYLLYELESQQAAINVANDFEATIVRLSSMAGSFRLCENEVLRAKGYRVIHFRKHKYLMVYSLQRDTAYVIGIYHDLQDYENALR